MGIYSIRVLWILFNNFKDGLTIDPNTHIGYRLSEFLINYHGGFVRRGILGEIIYLISSISHVDPRFFIGGFCLICFLFVVIFFISQFKQEKICWWILPLNICLANVDIIRKDYMFVVALILIMYCYKSGLKTWLKFFLINSIAIFTILSHEVFFFYCIPLLCWIIIKDNTLLKAMPLKIAACSPMVATTLITFIFHGNLQTATLIADSWTPLLDASKAQIFPYSEENRLLANSITALTWDSKLAMNYHYYLNFAKPFYNISGFVLHPVIIIVVLFFLINYFNTFSNNDLPENKIFSEIVIIQFISLLPIFTFLSCDTYRVFFYWTTSSLVFWLLTPQHIAINLFPHGFSIFCGIISNFFTINTKYSIWILSFLLLILCVPNIGNDLEYSISYCAITQIYWFFHVIASILL